MTKQSLLDNSLQAGSCPCQTGQLPTFAACVERLIQAENDEGWLHHCDEAGQFLIPTSEFVSTLVALLGRLSSAPIVEVCAGRGDLARALTDTGLRIIATDAKPSSAGPVQRLDAAAALKRFRPTVVLGSFIPVDSGVDQMIMASPWVQHFMVLNARFGGVFGSQTLWRHPQWSAQPMDAATQWMLTRHDVWLGGYRNHVLQHGEAWLFSRTPPDRGHRPATNDSH